jgi:hypothetical protein
VSTPFMSVTGGGDQMMSKLVDDSGVHCTWRGGELGTKHDEAVFKASITGTGKIGPILQTDQKR